MRGLSLCRVTSSLTSLPDAAADQDALLADIVRDSAASLVIDGGERIDRPDEILAELVRLGLVLQASQFAQEVQRVSAPDFPAAAGNGDAGQSPGAAGDGGGRSP